MNDSRIPGCFKAAFLAISFSATGSVLAADFGQYRLPDEYEATPGHGLAMGNSGIAATGGLSSVANNPSMIAMEKQYTVGGGFHWPTRGREFFDLGVVDSRSASIAAGFTYSTFTDDYYSLTNDSAQNIEKYQKFDSPVVRRGRLALAQAFRLLSFGISGQYVEGHQIGIVGDDRIKGTSIGMGTTVMITPQLRAAASVDNLANRKIANYAPRAYRMGAAYLISGGNISLHADYLNRERIATFEAPIPAPTTYGIVASDDSSGPANEQMLSFSGSARIQDMVRLFAGYGQGLTDGRQMLSGGAGLVSDNFALTYAASRPYMSMPETQNALSLSVNVSM